MIPPAGPALKMAVEVMPFVASSIQDTVMRAIPSLKVTTGVTVLDPRAGSAKTRTMRTKRINLFIRNTSYSSKNINGNRDLDLVVKSLTVAHEDQPASVLYLTRQS